MSETKLYKDLHTNREKREFQRQIIARYLGGETKQTLANECGVTENTIMLWCRKRNIYKNKNCIREQPDTPKFTDEGLKNIRCLDLEQPYKDNIRWAADQAGRFLREKTYPPECPNNTAYYLFIQALDKPSDFIAKLNSIESKEKVKEDDDELEKDLRRSEEEIQQFLEGLRK